MNTQMLDAIENCCVKVTITVNKETVQELYQEHIEGYGTVEIPYDVKVLWRKIKAADKLVSVDMLLPNNKLSKVRFQHVLIGSTVDEALLAAYNLLKELRLLTVDCNPL